MLSNAGLAYEMVPWALTTMMMSDACCTSARKRPSLRRNECSTHFHNAVGFLSRGLARAQSAGRPGKILPVLRSTSPSV